jgi:hypothetical protein
MNIKEVTEDVMSSLMKSKTFGSADGADKDPIIESDNKSHFTMYKSHDLKVGESRGSIKPIGEWQVKVTLEMSYKKHDE